MACQSPSTAILLSQKQFKLERGKNPLDPSHRLSGPPCSSFCENQNLLLLIRPGAPNVTGESRRWVQQEEDGSWEQAVGGLIKVQANPLPRRTARQKGTQPVSHLQPRHTKKLNTEII